MKKIAIVGGGAWGTALAIAISRAPHAHDITLWAHETEVVESIAQRRVNDLYLPEMEIPRNVQATTDLRAAAASADIVLGVMPAAHARTLYEKMRDCVRPGTRFISATKGLEPGTLLRMTQVIRATVPPELSPHVGALSGPSFAREVARGDPTAIVVASEDSSTATEIQEEFSGPAFRLYTNPDVAGVEIGGAVKNVIAIAAGVAEGLGLGHNTMAALITRGLAEIMRLGAALGARSETLAGLAGMGDLVLTCTGSLSRNRTLGIALGQGRRLKELLAETRTVAEGVGTTEAAHALSQRHSVETPITEQMFAVLYENRPPREAIRRLMERPLKQE
jgi:glycerol-3-phosphate dehydrogenase (NAD(P)+)